MPSVIKHSYIRGGRQSKARATAHVNYIAYRRGDDRGDRNKPRLFYSSDREDILPKQVKRDINRLERSKVETHKLIVSPGVKQVDLVAYTRHVLQDVSRAKGQELDYRFVIHKNTDHEHAHVVVFGRDKEGREVKFNGNDHRQMRDAGDRYLDRFHQWDRLLDRAQERSSFDDRDRDVERQMKDGYDRVRGDTRFEQLWGDVHNRPEKEVPAPDRQWDKEKAIAHLPEDQKIERGEKTYSRFSSLDDLRGLRDDLDQGKCDPIKFDKYKDLDRWIRAKDERGDDVYDRKAKNKYENRGKKNRDGEVERDFDKLDKDARDAMRQRDAGEFGKGGRQRQREQQGRLGAEHSDYTGNMARKRLEDLKNKFPDQADRFDQDLKDLDRLKDERRQDFELSGKWEDFDRLLGEEWKSPEPKRDIERENKEQEGSRQSRNEAPDTERQPDRTDDKSRQMTGERILGFDQLRAEHESQARDQQELERERDEDSFGRGER